MSVGSATIGAAGLLAVSSLYGCSPPDEKIAQDYVIWDLGGSNQTLHGGNGSVDIDAVTAYKLDEPHIYVEIGGYPREDDRARRSCTYARIDMRSAEVTLPPKGTVEARQFADAIEDGGHRHMQWTCVDLGFDLAGSLYSWASK